MSDPFVLLSFSALIALLLIADYVLFCTHDTTFTRAIRRSHAAQKVVAFLLGYLACHLLEGMG